MKFAVRTTAWVLAGLALACGTSDKPSGGDPDGGGDQDGGGGGGGDDGGGPGDRSACAPVFAHDKLPSYHVTIDEAEWNKLVEEFWSPLAVYQSTGQWPVLPKNYHPVAEFRYEDTAATAAMIRLKGNSSWRHAIENDGDKAKMQFVVSFNETNPDGRFFGMRKIEFDMPRNDRSFLRQRMGLEYLRADMGLPAQCANSARLYINGQYYGVYTAMERLDKEFLQRNFGDDDEGTLWDAGRRLRSNEATANTARRDELFAATSMAQVAPLADMDHAVRSWAAEAMMPDGDGYYGGTHNYFLYDHPTRGFLWIPYDKDASFDYRPFDALPQFWSRDEQPKEHYLLVMEDPAWLAKWEKALCEEAVAAYDVPRLQARVDAWVAQIEQAVREDTHLLYGVEDWQRTVAGLREHVAKRKEFVQSWCECRKNGGADGDGDGAAWCRECDDTRSGVGPHVAEVCGPEPNPENLSEMLPLDNDCDGRIDEGCAVSFTDASCEAPEPVCQ